MARTAWYVGVTGATCAAGAGAGEGAAGAVAGVGAPGGGAGGAGHDDRCSASQVLNNSTWSARTA
eukprot:1861425-Prymnesium_polylepis.1